MRALLLVLAACGGQNLGDPSIVQDLRVLAMVAEPPQVQQGATTRVTAYLFDPDNAGRPVRARFFVCDALGGSAGTVECAFDGSPSVTLAEVDTVQVSTDLFVASFDYTARANFLSDKGALPQRYGFDEVILVRAENGLRSIHGSKRVTVLPAGVLPNVNPTLPGLLLSRGDTPIGGDAENDTLVRDTVYQVTPVALADDAQTYDIVNFNGEIETLTEELSFSWTCSPDCTISQRISYAGDVVTVTTPEIGAVSGRFTLQAVVRDGRGGEAIRVRTFALLPFVRVNL